MSHNLVARRVDERHGARERRARRLAVLAVALLAAARLAVDARLGAQRGNRHLERAKPLRDAAGLAARDVGVAQRVEQRRLA